MKQMGGGGVLLRADLRVRQVHGGQHRHRRAGRGAVLLRLRGGGLELGTASLLVAPAYANVPPNEDGGISTKAEVVRWYFRTNKSYVRYPLNS